MRISDWSSDVCSSDLNASYWASSAYLPGRLPKWYTAYWIVSYLVLAFGTWFGRCRSTAASDLSEMGRCSMSRLVAVTGACGALGSAVASQLVERGRSEEHTSELQSLMRI